MKSLSLDTDPRMVSRFRQTRKGKKARRKSPLEGRPHMVYHRTDGPIWSIGGDRRQHGLWYSEAIE